MTIEFMKINFKKNPSYLVRRKLLIIFMRLFVFLCSTTVFSLTPDSVLSQNSKVKIDSNKSLTVDEIFDLIMEQTDYDFIYQEGIFDDFPKIQVEKGRISTNKLLKKSLSKGNYKIDLTENNTVLVKKKVASTNIATKQEFKVSGTITDENGQPLPGASVVEKGTTNGTQTNFEGYFTIEVSNPNSILEFSYLGFVTEEITVGADTQINIELSQDSANLDEVIIVGYGTQTREKITGSVATVDVEQVVENRPLLTIQQALQGIEPGLVISQGSGRPGASPNLSIRGGRGPLVLLDGFEVNIDDVDPNSIENISILKDAAATAIYGLDASNGVILITSKIGRKNSSPTFKYSVKSSRQGYTRIPTLTNTYDYMLLKNLGGFNADYWNVDASGEFPDLSTIERSAYFPEDVALRAARGEFPDTSWSELVYAEDALQFNHSLNLMGGSESTRYSLTAAYVTQNGVNVSDIDDFSRYNFRANIRTDINRSFKIGANIAFTHRETNSIPISTQRSLRALPYFPVRDTDPLLGLEDPADLLIVGDNGDSPNVILASTDGTFTEALRDVLELQANATVNIIKGLSFDQNVNFRFINANRTNWNNDTDRVLLNFNNTTGEFENYQIVQANADARSLSRSSSRTFHIVSQSILRANYEFDRHTFDFTGGFQAEKLTGDGFNARRQSFLTDAVISLQLGSIEEGLLNGTTNRGGDRGRYGFFGSLTYDFDGKYIATASVRNDQSSRFAPGNRSASFPSFSLAWNLHREAFLSDADFFDQLKLRVSWGQEGDDSVRDLAFQSLVNQNRGYPFPGGLQPGLVIANFANENLSWETVTSYNVAIDASLYKRFLGVTFELWNKRRSDVISGYSTTSEFGLPAPQINSAEFENRGFDFKLSHRSKIGEVSLNLGVSLSNIRSKWLDLGSLTSTLNTGSATLREVGQPVGIRQGFTTDGLFASQQEVDEYRESLDISEIANEVRIGFPKILDIGGPDGEPDGVISRNHDYKIIGNPKGNYNIGFQLGATWREFSFNAFFSGVLNRTIYATGGQVDNAFSGGISNAFTIHKESFSIEIPDKNAILPAITEGLQNYSNSDYWIRKASYVRLTNINLSYQAAFVDSINFIKKLRLYASADNPLLIWDNFFATKYGWDPQLGFGSVQYPLATTVTIGLDITL